MSRNRYARANWFAPILSFVIGTCGTASAGEFGKPTYTPVGQNPVAIVSADFNHDGKTDLAVGNIGDSTVSVLLGEGDATFQSAITYSVPTLPFHMELADLNNDGALDIVVTGSGTFAMLTGNGDGTFQVSSPLDVFAFEARTADFNGDGNLDLALVEPGSMFGLCSSDHVNGLLIYPGNGDGTFQPSVYTYCGQSWQLRIGDFNQDGKYDLVSLFHKGDPQAYFGEYLGNGDGTLHGPVRYSLGTNPAYDIAVIDVNADGELDVVSINSYLQRGTQNIAVALGNGDGSFQPVIKTFGGSEFVGYGLVTGDVNQDGAPDVVAGTWNGLSVFLGRGDGTFAPGSKYFAEASSSGIVVGDFNGDGQPDIAVAGGSSKNAVAVLLNLGSHPSVKLSAVSLQFGDQQVNTTSPPQKVTLTNTGTLRLDISSVTVSGDFLEKNTCGNSVAIGASCAITVQFRPRGEGLRKGKVTVTDNSKPPVQVIQLTGTGVQ